MFQVFSFDLDFYLTASSEIPTLSSVPPFLEFFVTFQSGGTKKLSILVLCSFPGVSPLWQGLEGPQGAEDAHVLPPQSQGVQRVQPGE